jgi:hypothetical protein
MRSPRCLSALIPLTYFIKVTDVTPTENAFWGFFSSAPCYATIRMAIRSNVKSQALALADEHEVSPSHSALHHARQT